MYKYFIYLCIKTKLLISKPYQFKVNRILTLPSIVILIKALYIKFLNELILPYFY